jgi:hypothetical protein
LIFGQICQHQQSDNIKEVFKARSFSNIYCNPCPVQKPASLKNLKKNGFLRSLILSDGSTQNLSQSVW